MDPLRGQLRVLLMLASQGWQRASKKSIRNSHASHIPQQLQLQNAIRFSAADRVAGYLQIGIWAVRRQGRTLTPCGGRSTQKSEENHGSNGRHIGEPTRRGCRRQKIIEDKTAVPRAAFLTATRALTRILDGGFTMSETVHQEQTTQTAAQPERTFTQAEMDAIIGDRLNRERQSTLTTRSSRPRL